MSTTVQSRDKTIRLLDYRKISVPRTERFVGFDVFAALESGSTVVIKQAIGAAETEKLKLGRPLPTAKFWADRWYLEAATGQQTKEDFDLPEIANEYVDGVSLTEFVKQMGALPLSKMLTLVAALEAASVTDPQACSRLTPDRVMFTAAGAPKFLVRDSPGVGPAGCVWFALTGQRPPRQRLSISLIRNDLPRALKVVIDAFMKGEKELSDVCAVLQRFTAPEPMQLGLAGKLSSAQKPGQAAGMGGLQPILRVAVSLFTIGAVLLAGWQLQEFVGEPRATATASSPKPMPKDYGWDAQTCLWDRLATQRQAALQGHGSVQSYTLPASSAAASEQRLLDRVRAAGVEFTGLRTRLVPGQHDGKECVDPVGLMAWQPERSRSANQELQVFSLISAHQQRDGTGAVRSVKSVKQQLSVQLRLHRGRWVISSIAVADGHAQS